MWFARLFGGRADESDYEEATAVAPSPAPEKAPVAASRPVAPAQSVPAKERRADKRKGFDPYNSGAFERRNAWERVNRR